jgi:hypothetical protein
MSKRLVTIVEWVGFVKNIAKNMKFGSCQGFCALSMPFKSADCAHIGAVHSQENWAIILLSRTLPNTYHADGKSGVKRRYC